MIYVGIDDTDTADSPGTNRLARWLAGLLLPEWQTLFVLRHQLLVDPRIAYTRKNSAACLLLRSRGLDRLEALAGRIRRAMAERFVAGSDPGLCVATQVTDQIVQFGKTCQTEVVSQQEARRLAARSGVWLEGVGGTQDGVIGALAAVGLAATGNDGRVVQLGSWPDDLSGVHDADFLLARGVREIRPIDSGPPVLSGEVDVGKRLRPNWRGGRAVLFVDRSREPQRATGLWRAVRLA